MVISPLLVHSYLQRNVDECEHLYGKCMEAGGKLTIDMLNYVFETYRRSGDID